MPGRKSWVGSEGWAVIGWRIQKPNGSATPYLKYLDGGLVDGHNNGSAGVTDIPHHPHDDGCGPVEGWEFQ